MNEKENRVTLYRIIASVLMLIAALLIKTEGALRFCLFLLPYLTVSYDIIWKAAKNIAHGEIFDENFLMIVASAGAFAIAEYPEAVAVMLFYRIGELFQDIAVGKSRKAVSALTELRPEMITVIRNGEEISIPPEEAEVGETMCVRPGERIALDGVVSEGTSALNMSALTGESLPVDVQPGDNITSGALNLRSPLNIVISALYRESTVARILALVENTSAKKSSSEKFITKFARIYTPCVVVGAVLLAFLPPLITGSGLSEWVNRALIFLVVSCPCALVVSVPLSFFCGIGGASKKGILFKGSTDMETLSKVGTVVFDKTGTLTKGVFSVTAVHPHEMPESELLDIAALAESYSDHPIALSILRAHGGHIDKSRIGEVKELAGLGIEAVIDGRLIRAGNGKLMELAHADWHECSHPGTIIHIARENEYCGHIVISDEIKSGSREAIDMLSRLGIKNTVMLTGDNAKVASAVAEEIGISVVRSSLMPDEKLSFVEEMTENKEANGLIAFVGDGINDAPALVCADSGISMGGLGSDAAIEASDVVLMNDDPRDAARAISIARKTMLIARENIVFSLAVKAIVLVTGALGISGMWLAVFADVGVTFIAVLNSMRMLWYGRKRNG